jgi:hypothetical protein
VLDKVVASLLVRNTSKTTILQALCGADSREIGEEIDVNKIEVLSN